MRECREVGSKFQGAPFDACPQNTQTFLNSESPLRRSCVWCVCSAHARSRNAEDNYCSTLWCTNDPGTCTTFRLNSQAQVMNDGIPCDVGKQCKSQECVFSAAVGPHT